MRVLFAPDSFKGSLSSVEVARALADGWARGRADDEAVLAPLADGGEGTLDAIEAAGGWTRRHARVLDPIRREIDGTWLERSDQGRVEAVVEMAVASGLSRLAQHERDPLGATSVGTGQLLLAAIDAGATAITLGIGGSATNDGGRGILEALGATVREGGGVLSIDFAGLDSRLAGIDLRVACDVDNPLLGPHGAAATYGPQKGASLTYLVAIDSRLGLWATALEAASGRRERETPGAGAAGGVGFALLCLQDHFGSFALRPGVELVMAATGFDAALAGADLVVTGEGRIDAQTAFGKTAMGVATKARAANLPCIAVGGGCTPEGIDALTALGVVVVPVSEVPQSVETAMAAGPEPLVRCEERLARLIGVGLGLVR